MPSLKMSLPFQIPQDEALQRIKNAAAQAKAQYSDKISDLQESWDGNVGTFRIVAMGHNVSGTVTVNPSAVELRASLPLIAAMFQGKIEGAIRQYATQLLS